MRCAEIVKKYANQTTINKLPSYYERDTSIEDKFVIRSKRRFNWVSSDKSGSLNRYKNYHKGLRKDLYYIYSPQRLWYLKRNGNSQGFVERSSLTITFASMHRLSELARYSPDYLAKHFEGNHNWLVSEFISTAPAQFIDEISSELTGFEFMPRGYVS